MSQNPYAHTEPSGLEDGYDQLPMTPERTSVLAIASLVFSIVAIPGCCLAGIGVVPGLIGTFAGVIALLTISSSDGRLGGRGLAISGVIVGLVFTAFSIALIFGEVYYANQLARFQLIVERAQNNDPTAVRAMLSSGASNTLTDEDIDTFASEVDLVLGAADPSTGVLDFVTSYRAAGPQRAQDMQTLINTYYPPPNQVLPIAIRFDGGNTYLLIVADPSQQISLGVPAAKNVGVIDPATGDAIWLIDPASGP